MVAVQTHGSYIPTGDHALIELQARDVGRHPVLFGLYSREDWAHPGPAFSYLSAPFYRLLGEVIDLARPGGAPRSTGRAIAGMALIARRLAGTPAMLATLLAVAFLMRTLGAEFLRDPWNPYVTVLPYGLMVYLTWAMLCRRLWALPLGVAVATYLSQTHVGFVALALPLLASAPRGSCSGSGGANGAAATAAAREAAIGSRDAGARRPLAGPGSTGGGGPGAAGWRRQLRSGALAALLWLPRHRRRPRLGRSNLANIVRFFREGGDDATLLQGWGAVTGQFALPPEWLVDSNGQSWSGEDVHVLPPGAVAAGAGGAGGGGPVAPAGRGRAWPGHRADHHPGAGHRGRGPHRRRGLLLPAAVAVDRPAVAFALVVWASRSS